MSHYPALLKNIHIIRENDKEILTYRGYHIHTIKDIHNQFGVEVFEEFAEYFIEKHNVRTQKASDILWMLSGGQDIGKFFLTYLRKIRDDYLNSVQAPDKIYEMKESVELTQNNPKFAFFNKDTYVLHVDGDMYRLKKNAEGLSVDSAYTQYEIMNPFLLLDIQLLLRFINESHDLFSISNVNIVLNKVSRGAIGYEDFHRKMQLGLSMGLNNDELWDWLSIPPQTSDEISLTM